MDWGYVASGFSVGLLVGLTGVGGGSLMTPLLMLLFGYPVQTAVGTDLLFAAITKTAGVWSYARQRQVDWRLAGLLALSSLPAAALALYGWHAASAAGHAGGAMLAQVLGLALCLTAGAIVLKPILQRHPRPSGAGSVGLTLIAGATLGTLVALSSVGAGALGTVALLWLYPALPVARLIGTELAYAVPLTLLAGLIHLDLGNVDPRLLLMLLVGSLPGIALGSRLGQRLPERLVRGSLALVLFLTGARLVL